MMRQILAALILFLNPGSSALADNIESTKQVTSPMPPMILRHSLTEFTVYQGDEVTLSVLPGGADIQTRWEKDGHIFCRTTACTVNTGNMVLGSHRLMVVLTNSGGTIHLEFLVKVVAAPMDHRPTAVSPRLVEGQDLQGIGPEDWAIRLQQGRASIEFDGYSQRRRQSIGSLPTRLSLEANPKIETGAQSQVQFGRAGVIDVQAMSDSELALRKTIDGMELTMSKGILRVRLLDDSATATTLKVCDFATVTLATHADVVATCSQSEPVLVSVLRGSAKVSRIAESISSDVKSGAIETVVYGQTLVVPGKVEDSLVLQPVDTFKIEPIVATTSRDHLPDVLEEWQVDSPFHLLLPQIKDPKAAKLAARQYLDRQEYLSALETLAPFWPKLKQESEGTLLMAQAYAGLFLYDEALGLMRQAIKLAPDSPMPHYEIGRLFASVSKWKMAAKAYVGADQRDYSNQKDLHSRLGDALQSSGDSVEALRSFRRVLWYPPRDSASAKAQQQIDDITDQNVKSAYTRLGLFYDSAILRVADTKLDLGDGVVRSNYGSGFQAEAGISLWPYRSAEGWTEIALEGSWRNFIKPTNRELAQSKYRVRFASEMSLGGERAARFLAVGMTASLGQDLIGAEHQLTRVSAGVSVGSPLFQKIRFELLKSYLVDPAPERPRSIEPIRWELGKPGDFTAAQTALELAGDAWTSGDWRIAMKMLSRTTAYRADSMRGEDFSDLGGTLQVFREPHTRTALRWQLTQNTRKFAKATDGRKDNDLIVATIWDYYLTPDLKQTLEASYEMQSSTRSANQFKRKYVCYQLQLDF